MFRNFLGTRSRLQQDAWTANEIRKLRLQAHELLAARLLKEAEGAGDFKIKLIDDEINGITSRYLNLMQSSLVRTGGHL